MLHAVCALRNKFFPNKTKPSSPSPASALAKLQESHAEIAHSQIHRASKQLPDASTNSSASSQRAACETAASPGAATNYNIEPACLDKPPGYCLQPPSQEIVPIVRSNAPAPALQTHAATTKPNRSVVSI